MHTGTVRWFSYSKGCGFIVPDDGSEEVFAHYSALGDDSVQSLQMNERVRYKLSFGPKGAIAHDIFLLVEPT